MTEIDWSLNPRSHYAATIRQFERECSTDSAPSIETILGNGEPINLELLVELVQIDFEWRIKRGQNATVESYLGRFPILVSDNELVLDLIESEYRFKSRSDPSISVDSMAARFPQLDDAIRARLGEERSTAGNRLTSRDCAVPTQIDKFEIIQEIGRGSFGIVFKARDTELSRIVAIKMPRAGRLASDAEIERFLREARSASQLNHPNIVKLLEVGHSDGLCYLVSEYIDGQALNASLRSQAWTHRSIVQILVQIADAVHYAHEAGVIHRDLKLANVILDQQYHSHVTDLGLAKLEGSESTMTMEGQVIGTPAYMSPEQAKGSSHMVDSRTDIYSLGVMLYEMLSRELPFQGSPRMVLMQVLNDEPRSMRRLDDKIPRDLDTVVLKCLSKDPNHRYRTAGELAAELRRWLAGEPVLARPIGIVDSTWRWAKRNPRFAGLGALVAGLMMIISIGSAIAALAIQGQRVAAEKLAIERTELAKSESAARELAEQKQRESEAARERETQARETSDAVADFMAEMLGRPNPEVDGRTVTIADALPRSVEKLNKDFADRPFIRSKLLNSIGLTYTKLGLYKESVEVLSKSFEVYQEEFGAKDKTAAGLLSNLATAYRTSGNAKKAIEAGEQSLAIYASAPNATLYDQTATKVNLASAYKIAGDLKKSIELQESCQAEYAIRLGPKHRVTLSSLADLASAYSASGRLSEARAAYEKAREASIETLGLENAETLRISNNLGSVLNQLGKCEEAIPLLEETLESRRKVLGEMHPHTTSTVNNLAMSYTHTNQIEKATLLNRANLETRKKALGPSHIQTLKAMNNLSGSLFNGGKSEEGIKLLEEAIAIADSHDLGKNTDIMTFRSTLATMYSAAKQTEKAFSLCKETLELQLASLGEDHPYTMHTLHTMGIIQIDRKEYEDAKGTLSKAYANRRKKFGADNEDTLLSMNGLARVYGEMGRIEEAKKLFVEALEIRMRKSKDDWRTFSLMTDFGKFCFEQERYEEAEKNLRDGVEGMKKEWNSIPHESRPNLESARKKLVELYTITNRSEEAEKFGNE